MRVRNIANAPLFLDGQRVRRIEVAASYGAQGVRNSLSDISGPKLPTTIRRLAIVCQKMTRR